MRFDRGGRTQASAYLKKAAKFLPRLPKTVKRMIGQGSPGCPRVFVSDCADWIMLGVKEHLPDWQHVADHFHIRQHLHVTAEVIYGKHIRKVGK